MCSQQTICLKGISVSNDDRQNFQSIFHFQIRFETIRNKYMYRYDNRAILPICFTFPIRLSSDLPLYHTSDNEIVEIFQEDIYVEVYYAFGCSYAILH